MDSFPTPLQYNPSGTEKEEAWWRYLDKETLKHHGKAAAKAACENENKDELESKNKARPNLVADNKGRNLLVKIDSPFSDQSSVIRVFPPWHWLPRSGIARVALQSASVPRPACSELHCPAETDSEREGVSLCVSSVENAVVAIPPLKNMGLEGLQKVSPVCPHCRQVFPSPFHLLEHATTCTMLTAQQACKSNCCCPPSEDAPLPLKFDRHRREIYTKQCIHGVCNSDLNKQEEIKQAKCVHKDELPFSCVICAPAVKLPLDFQKDSETVGNESTFVCEKCGKCCKYCKNITSQKNSQIHEQPYQCDHCDANFKQWVGLKNHQYVHNSDKPYACDTCGTSFKQSRVLETHKRIHSNVKPYVCDVCNAAFKQSSHLKQHKRIHTNETPYACDMCSAAFKQSVHLKQHRRVHTNEKPYVCDVCPSAFKQSEHLKQHKRIHTNETPYACDMCSAAFKQSVHLKQHRRIHTNEKPYSCDLCGAAFKQSEHLKLHKRTHTNEKPYACDLCSAAFKQSAHLKQHKRTHAPEKVMSQTFCHLESH